MSQPQYEEVYQAQKTSNRELLRSYAEAHQKGFEEAETKYYGQMMSYKLEVEALKIENDRIWKIFVDKLAEERIANRMKELA